jgi:hypothetical protein
VYARRLDDRTLSLIVSGRLWRNSLIMKDRETGTFWSHVTGEAMEGELKDRTLSRIPSVHTTWSEWVEEHPQTLVLKKEASIHSSRYEDYFEDPSRTGIFRAQWLEERMPGKDKIWGLTVGPHALAVADSKLDEGDFVQAQVGDAPVVVVRGPDNGVRAFFARIKGQDLEFEADSTSHILRDKATGSLWKFPGGVSEGGKLAGSKLEEISVTYAFWFAWSGFYPNTAVLD